MATTVSVEFYGVLRFRAGRDAFTVPAASIGAALAWVEAHCPPLAGTLLDASGALREEYRVALNGGVISLDAAQALVDGDCLVLLSAQAGG